MTEKSIEKLKRISPFHYLIWLFTVWGVWLCTNYAIHIFERLPELDDFNEAGARWLLGSKQAGDFHWEQYKLDLIERVFLNYSVIAVATALVTLLAMCLFRSKKPALIWTIAAPTVLIVFTATQGELFDCIDYRDFRNCMTNAILYQTAISGIIAVYCFTDRKYLGIVSFFAAAFFACETTEHIGQLSIHRSESMGWIYADMFILLVMNCITHLKKQTQINTE